LQEPKLARVEGLPPASHPDTVVGAAEREPMEKSGVFRLDPIVHAVCARIRADLQKVADDAGRPRPHPDAAKTVEPQETRAVDANHGAALESVLSNVPEHVLPAPSNNVGIAPRPPVVVQATNRCVWPSRHVLRFVRDHYDPEVAEAIAAWVAWNETRLPEHQFRLLITEPSDVDALVEGFLRHTAATEDREAPIPATPLSPYRTPRT
jgi:hypothetical protein